MIPYSNPHPRGHAGSAAAVFSRMLRPVVVPHDLIGHRTPCDIFNARGAVWIKAGSTIPQSVGDPSYAGRFYCRATEAGQISFLDPIRGLQRVAGDLSDIAARIARGEHVSAGELASLARQVRELWAADADACLGYARLAQFGRHSIWHTIHVALLTAELAAACSYEGEELESMIGGALTMNLAQLSLHDEMYELYGALDSGRQDALRLHPLESVRLLGRIGKFDGAWVDAVALHHENVDGSGYPLQLKGADIALSSRIVRIADTFAARVTGRRSRPPRHWNIMHAREIPMLVEHVFGADLLRLDHTLVRRLIDVLGRFPPGSLVRLSNRELALVTRRQSGLHNKPSQVYAIFDALGHPLEAPRLRQIGFGQFEIRGYAHDQLPKLPDFDWPTAWGYGL
ncbi:MAG: HD domain-containing phosphohydrolase [Sulfuricella sp.]